MDRGLICIHSLKVLSFMKTDVIQSERLASSHRKAVVFFDAKPTVER